MGKFSRKNRAFHLAHVSDVAKVVEQRIAAKEPLPGQPIVHGPGRVKPSEPMFFTTGDGTRYAVARDGSFRRAPDGSILPMWGGEPA